MLTQSMKTLRLGLGLGSGLGTIPVFRKEVMILIGFQIE
jgi:hypothetical protein